MTDLEVSSELVDAVDQALDARTRREAHASLAQLMAPPPRRSPVAPHQPPPEVEEEYAEGVACPDCGVGWLVEAGQHRVGKDEGGEDLYEPLYECRGCEHLPHLGRDGSSPFTLNWWKLLGLQLPVDTAPYPIEGPTHADLRALGCLLWAEADRTEANPHPFAHVPWDRVRAECYRRWPDERFWRSPTLFAQARELAARGDGA